MPRFASVSLRTSSLVKKRHLKVCLRSQFNKNVHDKNVVWSLEHPSLAPKFCVLRNTSLLYDKEHSKVWTACLHNIRCVVQGSMSTCLDIKNIAAKTDKSKTSLKPCFCADVKSCPASKVVWQDINTERDSIAGEKTMEYMHRQNMYR